MALTEEAAGRLIAVKMSEGAADRLAQACARIENDAWRAVDKAATEEGYARAMETYEWISWGANWMRNPDARLEVNDD